MKLCSKFHYCDTTWASSRQKHRQFDCLLNILFRPTLKLCITGPLGRESTDDREFTPKPPPHPHHPHHHPHRSFSSSSHAISYCLSISVCRWISQLVPEILRMLLIHKRIVFISLRLSEPLTRYVKLRVAHTPGMTGTFPIPTCITARAWCTCRNAYRDR